MKQILVHKYGGRSLATPENIKSVAQKVAAEYHKGHPMIVVVSAMGERTDELTKLAHQVSSSPAQREMDMLLTAGERVSIALMTMALIDLKVPAISFTGSQAGIMTDGEHNNASIREVKPIRVEEELKKGHLVVLAGFQGVNPDTKEITTLGRNGSDTTAVAMAGHFSAPCRIFKEVKGICSADPQVYPHAVHYKNVSFEILKEMCECGTQVLHKKSVEMAERLNVKLSVHNLYDASEFSNIENLELSPRWWAIACATKDPRISLIGPTSQLNAEEVKSFVAEFDEFVRFVDETKFSISFIHSMKDKENELIKSLHEKFINDSHKS